MFVILQELDIPIQVKQDGGVLSEEKTKTSVYSVLGISHVTSIKTEKSTSWFRKGRQEEEGNNKQCFL